MITLAFCKEKFKDHIAEAMVLTEKTKVFLFHKPGTTLYLQKWVILNNVLVVTGDCYDSVYAWSQPLTLKFLAGCDLQYFSGKCRADKDGSRQEVFDAEYAAQKLKEIAVNFLYDYQVEEAATDSLEEKLKACRQTLIDRAHIMDSEFEAFFTQDSPHACYDLMVSHPNIFGRDLSDYNFLKKSATPYFHLAALQVAYEKQPDLF